MEKRSGDSGFWTAEDLQVIKIPVALDRSEHVSEPESEEEASSPAVTHLLVWGNKVVGAEGSAQKESAAAQLRASSGIGKNVAERCRGPVGDTKSKTAPSDAEERIDAEGIFSENRVSQIKKTAATDK